MTRTYLFLLTLAVASTVALLRPPLAAGSVPQQPPAVTACAPGNETCAAPRVEPADSFFTVARTGSGRAMILIPGLLSPGEVWDGTVARFAGEYETHVLTLAGFGEVPPVSAEPFLMGVRDAVIHYIRQHELEQPILVGHSLGAFLSLWIAATEPDLIGHVVAVDGVPFMPALSDTTVTASAMQAQAAGIRAVFAGMSADALAAQTRMALSAQARDTAWHTRGAAWGAAADGATAGRAVADMMTTDIRNDVARITAPVLLLMAGHGMAPDVRATIASRYAGQIAGVREHRMVVVDDARHFIMLDEPDYFQATVAAFLNGAGGRHE